MTIIHKSDNVSIVLYPKYIHDNHCYFFPNNPDDHLPWIIKTNIKKNAKHFKEVYLDIFFKSFEKC